jgi:mono/diheme cytochrome c family protein
MVIWPAVGRAASAAPGSLELGHASYLYNCARCHGQSGTGDGPDGRVLTARPANLPQVIQGQSDERVVSRIMTGEPRLWLSGRNPENDAETWALYEYLRRLPDVRWKAADAGRRIYVVRCAGCHGWYGRPPTPSPGGDARIPRSLASSAFQDTVRDATLEALVRHDGERLPALDATPTESEAADLAAFVRLLSPGYEMYSRYCVTCHGIHGEMEEGRRGSRPWFSFDAKYFRSRYADEVRARIWHMLKGARPEMPHFEGVLEPGEARAIVAYLRTLPAR